MSHDEDKPLVIHGRDGRDGRNGKDGKDGYRGRDGSDGLDAYQVAVSCGFVGDRDEWLESLRSAARGDQGPIGKDGARGPQGPKGDDGPMGPMPRHQWDGTSLRFESGPGKWGQWSDLQGEQGKRGEKGIDGNHGLSGVIQMGGGTGGGGANLDNLAPASDDIPQEFIVRQAGAWVRATYAQMVAWITVNSVTVTEDDLPDGLITVGGEPITVDGEYVTVT